ncbi:MAG: hypothetical protein VKL42_19470 [Snowella sp.]|nr:hypothetical protein [Snowella sp.]
MNKSSLNDPKSLAENIIKDIESNELSSNLTLICLKTSRLAISLSDYDKSERFNLLADKSGEIQAHIDTVSERLDELFEEDNSKNFDTLHRLIQQSSESNLSQKKKEIRKLEKNKAEISKIKSEVYKYTLEAFYKLSFSDVSQGIFDRTKSIVDGKISQRFPNQKEKFQSVYDNINSENPENWSHAVTACRKILQALADELYPPQKGQTIKSNEKEIKIGQDNYINRLTLYIEGRKQSDTYEKIIGTHLDYIGDRIDSVYKATNKAAHTTIKSKQEAERYIIYTYLLIGDILSL